MDVVKLMILLEKLVFVILGISLVLSSFSCGGSGGASAPKIQTSAPTTSIQFQSQNPDVITQEIKKQVEPDLRDRTFDVTPESTNELREQIAAGTERRAVRESNDLKKIQEQYRLKQEEIKAIKIKVQKKYENNIPAIEKLNTKKEWFVKQAQMNSPEKWPLQNSRIKILEKDQYMEQFNVVTGKNENVKSSLIAQLNADNSDEIRVLSDNRLTTDVEALGVLGTREYGLLCKFKSSANLAQNDILNFESTDFLNDPKTKESWEKYKLTKVSFKYGSGGPGGAKSLEIICSSIGPIRYFDFVDNFADVIGFQNESGEIPDMAYFVDHPELADKFTREFTIINLEKFKFVDNSKVEHPEYDLGYALVRGEIMASPNAAHFIKSGLEKHSCSVTNVEGEVKQNQRFVWDSVISGEEDRRTNAADHQLIYKSDDGKTLVTFYCYMRRSGGVRPEIIAETFEGVLKFGPN